MDDNFQRAMRAFGVLPARHGQADAIFQSFGRDVVLFHDYMTAWKNGVRKEDFQSENFSVTVALLPSRWDVPAQYVYDFLTGADDAIRINMDMQLARRKVVTGYQAGIDAEWMSHVLNGMNYARDGATGIDAIDASVDWYRSGVTNRDLVFVFIAWQMSPDTEVPFQKLDSGEVLDVFKTSPLALSRRPRALYDLVSAGVPADYLTAVGTDADPYHIIDLWRTGIPAEYASYIGE